jgi:hypothetical protein
MQGLRQRIVVNDSVVSADLDDEMVLLNIETGVYFGLDPLGARIWQLLAAGEDEDAIVQAILAEYDIDLATLRADLAEFLAMLTEKGLVLRGDE